jgi:hypothetical protein
MGVKIRTALHAMVNETVSYIAPIATTYRINIHLKSDDLMREYQIFA